MSRVWCICPHLLRTTPCFSPNEPCETQGARMDTYSMCLGGVLKQMDSSQTAASAG